MSIFKDTIDNMRGYSMAMYSTWVYHKPTRCLFDAGEGVCLALRNYVFGIDKVFLSHGHYDHIGGLTGLLYTRASARGDKEKPLSVYYPKGCKQIERLKTFVSSDRGMKYNLEWNEVEPGDSVDLGAKKFVEVFKVNHSGLSLGYRIVERRKRLKKELEGRSKIEIREIVLREGSDAVNEQYHRTVLAYCGDSAPVDASKVRDAEVLFHEATFVDVSDRRGETHSSVDEAVRVAVDAGVKSLVLMHLSSRYNRKDMEKAARKAIKHSGWKGSAALLVRGELYELKV